MPDQVLRRWHCQPCPALAPFIDRFWGWQTSSAISLPMLLPGTGSECFFHIRPAPRLCSGQSLPEHYLVCPRSKITQFQSVSACNFIAVRFRNGMFRHFSGLPLAELNDSFVSVQDVWGGVVEPCLDALQQAVDIGTKVNCVQQFLLHQLQQYQRCHEQAVDALISHIYYAPNQRIEMVANVAGWSCRHLERSVKNTLALTPKRFARLARLHHTFRQISLHPEQDLLDIALERGFADQSHFIHDTRSLTGMSPRQLQHILHGESYYNPPSKLPE